MIVVQEEVFQALNIDRNNKRRVEIEQKAHEERKTQAVKNNRADEQQPMFKSTRPSTGSPSGGSGAVNPFWVLMIFTLLLLPKLCKRIKT